MPPAPITREVIAYTVPIYSTRGRILVLGKENRYHKHIAALKDHESLDVTVRRGRGVVPENLYAQEVDLVIVAANNARRQLARSLQDAHSPLRRVPIVELGVPWYINDLKLGIMIDHSLPSDITPNEFVQVAVAVWQRTKNLREVSPDTGLPGSRWIFERLENRIKTGQHYAFLLFDIDRFKSVSDAYGFARAGKFIHALGRALKQAASNVGPPTPDIAHIGGDDFLVICEAAQIRPFTKDAVERFEDAADHLYDPEDARRGYVLWPTPRGERKANLVTLSIGVVDSKSASPPIQSKHDAARVVSDMKTISKTKPGSWVSIARSTGSDKTAA